MYKKRKMKIVIMERSTVKNYLREICEKTSLEMRMGPEPKEI